MPPEILGEIFILMLPKTSAAVWSNIPWLLTHICRDWRQVAIATPALWARVVVDYYKRPSYALAAIKTQLQRTAAFRLYFYGGVNPGVALAFQKKVFKFLAKHSARWAELTIGVTAWLLPLLNALRDRLPILRRIWIQWEDKAAQYFPLTCFETAPALRDVTVYNMSPTTLDLLHLPAHQLTRYDADGPWAMHRPFLSQAHNLVELRLETDATVLVGTGDVIELLLLRRLYLTRFEVLDHLRAPALEDVGFDLGQELDHYRRGAANYESGNRDVLAYLDPFVQRSGCTLRDLCLRGSPHAQRVAAILNACPSIVSLTTLTSRLDELVQVLTVPNSTNTTVAPQLAEIYIGSQFFLDWPCYIAMLESRWRGEGCALRAATTALSRSRPDSEELAGLHSLRKEGFDVLLLQGEDADAAITVCVHLPNWN
ncbi:hypothetical protein C8R47DRAFT_1137166 [Mycena vitilis]|nr:hypothetical protein C8R47DRAFT_1137166 [Mycena vitilis]